MGRPAQGARYTGIAILLHWSMAIGIIALIAIGLLMTHATLAPARLFALYQLHKSIGITVLVSAVLRILWRLTHRPPELPQGMPELEKRAAIGTHWLFYAFMLGLPLTGWALVSASPLNIPTVLYGMIPWPHIAWFAHLSDKARAADALSWIHAGGGWALTTVVLIHAAAALRHRFVLGDDVLHRMLPTTRHGANPPDGSTVAAGSTSDGERIP